MLQLALLVRRVDPDLMLGWDVRRQGLGRYIVHAAARDLAAAGKPCFAYIVDGNVASERLFGRLAWRRVADVVWVGFGKDVPRNGTEASS